MAASQEYPCFPNSDLGSIVSEKLYFDYNSKYMSKVELCGKKDITKSEFSNEE